MAALRELQSAVLATLLERDDAAATQVRANGLSGARRLQVYRNNMLASLGEALAAVYPLIRRLVGEEFFGCAAREYIRMHPSRSGNVHDFGHAFPEFLSDFRGAAALPYLADVARLEWAYHEVFHAAERPPLDPRRIAEVSEDAQPSLCFVLQPAARLLASPYPVLRIWQVNQAGYAGAAEVNLDEGGIHLLVRQRQLEIEFWTLGAGEFALLSRLADDDTLGDAVAAALAVEPELDVGAVLARHVAAATLIDIRLPT